MTRHSRPVAMVIAIFAMLTAALVTPLAHAATHIDPTAVTSIEIHKFEEAGSQSMPVDGLPEDTSHLTPVPGATFTAKLVPGIDLTTNAGQQAAADLSPSQAANLVDDQNIAATAVTDAAGNATLTPLGVGLYYVQEVDTPAGFVGSAPFLVALPLTHPVERDNWLTTVHVYPKDARALIDLTVIDQDAISVGDTVHWISHADIPQATVIGGYQIDQIIADSLELVGPDGDIIADVQVSITGENGPELVRGVDYEISYDPATQTITIDFLPPGLEKLEQITQDDPAAQVRVDYDTIVHAEGVHVNEAVLYPSRDAVEKDRGVHDTATTKWGPLSILVHEQGNPDNLIPGGTFQLFLTEEDARAGTNPITVDGISEWTTDELGRIVINGLRQSDYVNDLDRDLDDPLYRWFWAVPTNVPDGWLWVDDNPLGGTVTHHIDYRTLIFLVHRTDAPVDPGDPVEPGDPGEPSIPVTGAQIGGIMVLAFALLAAGIAFVTRRREQQTSDLEQ